MSLATAASSKPVIIEAASVLVARAAADRYQRPGSDVMPSPTDAAAAYGSAVVWSSYLNGRFGQVAGSSMPAELAVKSAAYTLMSFAANKVGGQPDMAPRAMLMDMLAVAGGLLLAGQVTPML